MKEESQISIQEELILGLPITKQEMFEESDNDKNIIDCNNIIKSSPEFSMHRDNKIHTCDICGQFFKSEKGLRNHKIIHTEKIQCKFCIRTFRKQCYYLKHLDEHAEMEKVCDICNQSFNLLSQFEEHKEKCFIECDACKETFKFNLALKKHRKVCSKVQISEDGESFQCKICCKIFPTLRGLTRHFQSHGSNQKCSVCNKIFSSKSNITIHMQIHEGIKNFSCDVCGESFRLKKSLIGHMSYHTNYKSFVCDICHRRFNRQDILNEHIYTVHFPDKQYHCDICSINFKAKKYVLAHMKKFHQSGYSKVSNEKCDHLKSTTSDTIVYDNSPTSLEDGSPNLQLETNLRENHENIDKEPRYKKTSPIFDHEDIKLLMSNDSKDRYFYCADCDKKFTNKNNLRAHLTKNNCGEIGCKYCKRKFKCDSKLTLHYQENSGKFFSCSHCTFTSSSKCALKGHIETNHDIIKGRYRLQCDICNVFYFDSRQYNEHMKMHNQNMYHCTRCLQFFETKSLLIEHPCSKPIKNEVGIWTTLLKWDSDVHLNSDDIKLEENTCINDSEEKPQLNDL